MKKGVLFYYIVFFIVFSVFGTAREEVVFYEDFEGDDFLANPPGTNNPAGSCKIIEGALHCDGNKTDNTDRYVSWLVYPINLSLEGNFTVSYDTILKGEGNPQVGRGTYLMLYEIPLKDRHYDLRNVKGQMDFFNINHHTLSLGYGYEGQLYDLITTQYQPTYNTKYKLTFERRGNTLFFYINEHYERNIFDALNLTEFNSLIFISIGSVVIDNITISEEIPDETPQINPLLVKYAPIFKLHPREIYEPRAVESMFGNSDLKKKPNLIFQEKPVFISNITDLEDSERYYLDLTSVDLNEGISLADPEEFAPYPMKVYGTISEDSEGYKHLQYFLFYPFQDWLGMSHEGDWELVQVTLNPAERIESVSYKFDHFTMVYFDQNMIQFINNTHPVSYVAKGTHNNYAGVEPISLPDEFLFVNNYIGRFKGIELVSDGGPVLNPEGLSLDEGEFNYQIEEIFSSTPWIEYEGLWGQKTQYFTRDGPKGPKYNPRFKKEWNEPEQFTYGPDFPFFMAFLYSPLDISVYDGTSNLVDDTNENLVFYTGAESEPEAIMVKEQSNYTLWLSANEDGQFSLEIYYYDNETDQGIMLRYSNITNTKDTEAKIEAYYGSYFLLYLDYEGDGLFDRIVIPDENVTYKGYIYELPDVDSDGIIDFIDNCPGSENSDQADFNTDGKGDACDNPLLYKKQALQQVHQLVPKSKQEEVMLRLAERKINESLNQAYWDTAFSVNTRKALSFEMIATTYLDNIQLCYYLAKADSLVVEKLLLDLPESVNKDQARLFFQEGKEKMLSGEYREAILSYSIAWSILKEKA